MNGRDAGLALRVSALIAAALVAATAAAAQGLSVSRSGVLIHDGKPFRGIGVNYFDAFYRAVKDGSCRSYEAGFRELGRRHIPFCRILCGGFWPSEQALYENDPKEFFARLDRVVESAKKNEVGLILSLFWTPSTVPDLVGEGAGAWGDAKSKTQAYMRRFVRDVVTRYLHSPAVWGWEFGNEYGLGADLPNASEHRPPVVPSLGTPPTRSERDEWHYFDLQVAYAACAKEIRKFDATRIIETGDSVLRESAWHNRADKSWKLDSPEQQMELLRAVNPDPVDVVSLHLYGNDATRLPLYEAWSKKVRKPLFVGEFGVEAKDPRGRPAFEKLVAAMEGMEQPFAALWVFDFSGQVDTWSVTPGGNRSYQLDEIEAANRRIRRRGP
jgi:hypothetical protein